MKRKPARKTGARLLTNPDDAEALRLRDGLRQAFHKLAACVQSKNQLAAYWFCHLPGMTTDLALKILRDAESEPFFFFLAGELVRGLEGSIRQLNQLAEKRPEHFREVAGSMEGWPILRQLGSEFKAEARDTFPAFAERICLGADLPIRGDFQIDFGSVPNRVVATRLRHLENIRRSSKRHPRARWVPELPGLKKLLALPPLTNDPAVLDAWWKDAVEPLLESERDVLLRTTLRALRDRQRKRGKTDAVTWSRFKKDCRDALETNARRTGKS